MDNRPVPTDHPRRRPQVMVKGDRTQVALNIENDRLTAVAASAGVGGARVVVGAWLSADKPAGVDSSDAAALGRWVGEELNKAGLLRTAKAGGLVFAVPRGEVVLKRISFPPGPSRADLPGMVRLQMVRQLTVSPENAAIDFVPLRGRGGIEVPEAGTSMARAARAPEGSTAVLAGALQGDRLAWRQAVARAAGGTLRRVALRSAGAAALLAEAAQRRGGSTLGIALGSGSTEFVVVEDGQLVFARATDLFRPDKAEDVDAFAQKVAVEAKRTWMSYRVAPETSEIEAVVVLGADEAARLVAERCREALELPSEATDYPPFVEAPAGMSPADRTVMAPLVGLLAEPVIGRATMDFANPRQAPDLAAMRRQRALLAALLAIVVGGGAVTWGRLDLHKRESRLTDLRDKYAARSGEYGDYLRTRVRVEHLEKWMGARVDWLGHLDELVNRLPDPRSGVLDRLVGSGTITVGFKLPAPKRRLADGEWFEEVRAQFDMAGTVKHRDVADALRQALVKDSEYDVESKGPDTPDRFDLMLTTTRAKPKGGGGA